MVTRARRHSGAETRLSTRENVMSSINAIGGKPDDAVRRYLSRGRPYLDRRLRPELFLNARGGPLTRAGAFLIIRRLAEKEDRDLSWLDLSAAADLSPDGDTLLFYESGEGGGPEYSIFLRKTDGSLPVRLGPGRANGLSPDGKWALSIPLLDPGRIDIMPTGPGEIRSLRNPGVKEYDSAGFLGDGHAIFYTERQANGQPRAYVQDLAGGSPRPVPRHCSKHSTTGRKALCSWYSDQPLSSQT